MVLLPEGALRQEEALLPEEALRQESKEKSRRKQRKANRREADRVTLKRRIGKNLKRCNPDGEMVNQAVGSITAEGWAGSWKTACSAVHSRVASPIGSPLPVFRA